MNGLSEQKKLEAIARATKKTCPAVVGGFLLKLDLDTAGTSAEQVERLYRHLDARVANVRRVHCDICSLIFDDRLTACPGCGGNGDSGTSRTAHDAAIAELKARVTNVVELPVRKRPASNGAGVHPGAPEGTEADLDALLRRIRELAATSMFDLGVELARSKQLYQCRKGADGSPTYSTWEAFVEAETPISIGYAHRLAKIATECTREEFAELGVRKLAEILRAPEEARPQLLEHAKAQSVVEVKHRVDEIAPPKRRTKDAPLPAASPTCSDRPIPPPREEPKPAPPVEDGRITIVDEERKTTVTLKPTRSGSKTFRGELAHPNGVTTRYAATLAADATKITLAIEHVDADAEEPASEKRPKNRDARGRRAT